jgi:Putative phage metallopeptidase
LASVATKRPTPPERLVNGTFQDGEDTERPFEPGPELANWIIETFVTGDAPLCNPEHAHLREARLAALWSAVPLFHHGKRIVGQTHLGRTSVAAPKWYQARFLQQTVDWFGHVPDFVLTFDVVYALEASDAAWCALIEHELYHAAQAQDENGPRFSPQTGLPVWALRAHDVEEFLGVIARYGMATDELRVLGETLATAAIKPEFTAADLAGICGTCA